MTEINEKFIEPYIWGKKRHCHYDTAVDVAQHIQFHFNGYFQKPLLNGNDVSDNPYFNRLIDMRRPAESDMIKAFRRSLYLPVTKSTCDKIVTSLQKIFKSSDWKIDYSKTVIPSNLPEEMGLEDYCEEYYPTDGSIEMWAINRLMRWMLTDPNGIIVVMPLSFEIANGELYQPYSHIIESKDVLDYKYNEYFVFVSPYKNHYKNEAGQEKDGKIVIVVTKKEFVLGIQTGDDKFEIENYPHTAGTLPAWFLGGDCKTPNIHQPYYDSFIQGMLPALDAVTCDFSDLQAEKVQHMHSTMWYYQALNCPACQGLGGVLKEGKQVVCPQCKGRGGMSPSPYKSYELNLNSLDKDKQIPTPPMGYVTKDTTEMVSLMRQEIKHQTYQAYAAVHMEYLDSFGVSEYGAPRAQSGVAKAIDMTEANHFAHKIASQCVNTHIKPIYKCICNMRYAVIIQSESAREEMIPSIPVPEKFDFLADIEAEANLERIVNSQSSSQLKKLAEKNYIYAKYQDEPATINRLMIVDEHDPLPKFTVDEILALRQINEISKLDSVLHNYIESFATAIVEEDEGEAFFKLSYEEQKKKLYSMAEGKMKELDDHANIEAEAAAQRQKSTMQIMGSEDGSGGMKQNQPEE